MRRIGLTGGIGSGKSTVAGLLADHGAFVIDADAIAREVVAPGSEGLRTLVDTFGEGILQTDGALDRQVLARRVFHDEQARARLNAITHPLIARRTADLLRELPPHAVMVHDVPLLAELGMQDAYDVVVVVDTPDDLRRERLMSRGLSEQEVVARISAQASRDERLAIADVIIDNSGSLDDLRAQVDDVWATVSGHP